MNQQSAELIVDAGTGARPSCRSPCRRRMPVYPAPPASIPSSIASLAPANRALPTAEVPPPRPAEDPPDAPPEGPPERPPEEPPGEPPEQPPEPPPEDPPEQPPVYPPGGPPDEQPPDRPWPEASVVDGDVRENGPAIARLLAGRNSPEAGDVADLGVSGVDLAGALLDDYDAVVLVRAVQRGGAPGTLYVVDPQCTTVDERPPADLFAVHDLEPARVLRLVMALGGRGERLRLVGCEPETFSESEVMCLSAPVLAAVEAVLPLVESQLRELRRDGPRPQRPSGAGDVRVDAPGHADSFYAPGRQPE